MANNNYQAKRDRLKLIQRHLEIMLDRVEQEIKTLDTYDEEDEGFDYKIVDFRFEIEDMADRLKGLPEVN